MSLVIENGNAVHTPRRRDVFSFDREVAEIFEEMAQRSIPMYFEAHRLHISMLSPVLSGGDCRVVDVGSSTGSFFKQILREFGVQRLTDIVGLKSIAIDNSRPMLDKIAKVVPEVSLMQADIQNVDSFDSNVDVIVMMYLLQFIPDRHKLSVIEWAYASLKPGGYLILGQKDKVELLEVETLLNTEYRKFRKDNGYSDEEIDAKTVALRNSMWPLASPVLKSMLYGAGFRDVQETTRWLFFNTMLCRKPMKET